jgi:copper(I)-binding protein
LAIPAGETVTLAPGGYHLMFMELDGALEAGGSVDVTLTFERAGEVTLSMPVRARDGAGGDHAHHGSDG